MEKALTRAERRRLQRGNKKLLGWTRQASPKERNFKSNGWFSELDKVFVSDDKQYCVMSRELDTSMGKVIHVCLKNANESYIPWSEKQRIKGELFGVETTAIEVFPKESEVVDKAMMYHIWILKDFNIPFEYNDEELKTLNQVFESADKQYRVMSREIDTEIGGVIHAYIDNKTSGDMTWTEKQQLKNKLFGAETTAVEVLKKVNDTDKQYMRHHLWVLKDYILPFGL